MPEAPKNGDQRAKPRSLWASIKGAIGLGPKPPSRPKVSNPETNPSRGAEEICKDLGLNPPKDNVSHLNESKDQPQSQEKAETGFVVGPTIDDVPCGPFLVHKPSKGPVQVLDLAGKKAVTMGRSDRCDFFFVDTAVSRVHMVVELTEAGWTIRDMKSTYGSYLKDGTKLSDPHVLSDGEQFRLGRRIDLIFIPASDLLKIFEAGNDGISLSSQAA